MVTGNVIISPALLWYGTSPASSFTDGTHYGLYVLAPDNCSDIVVSGNYIEGAYWGVEGWPTQPSSTLVGNTIAGLHDADLTSPPTEIGSNQWGGGLTFNVPQQQNLDYNDFLAGRKATGMRVARLVWARR